MSGLRARLTRRGWIEPAATPDGRGQLVTLTDRGAELLGAAVPAWMNAQRLAVSLLGGRAGPALGEVT